MKRVVKTASMLALSLTITMAPSLFVSCGEDDDEKKSKSDLEGKWTKGCEKDGDGSNDLLYTFTGNNFTLTGVGYSDSKCATKSITLQQTGTFTTGGTFGEGKELDLKPAKLMLTLYSDATLTELNTICGAGFFVKDVAREVTASDCQGGYENDTKPHYGIYKIDGSKLYQDESDDTLDASSKEKRPKLLKKSFATKDA